MKLIDLLKITDEHTFLILSISFCGMQFETKHTAGFFKENGDELNNRMIIKMCNVEGEIYVRLEN